MKTESKIERTKFLEDQARIIEEIRARGQPIPRHSTTVKSYPSLEAFTQATGRPIRRHSRS